MAERESKAVKSAKKMIKRLDFGVRRKAAPIQKITPAPENKPKEIPKSQKVAPKAAPAPEKRPLAQSKALEKPVMVNRGLRMDFVPNRSNRPLMAPGAKLAKTAPSAKTAPAITTAKTAPTAPKPATPVRPASRGLRMDFVRRPAPAMPKKPQFKEPDDDVEPLMSDEELSVALSGFADATVGDIIGTAPKPEHTPKPNLIAKPERTAPSQTPQPETTTRVSITRKTSIIKPRPDKRRDAELDEELAALDELSDDIFGDSDGFDDIDRIEAEIEAEANDFIREPKPLFEDPLVQISKVREERDQIRSAKEAELFRENVLEEAKETARRAPYAALYSTKTPFLTSVNVEKRPLSASAPTGDGPEMRKAEAPLKNSYRARMKKQLDDDAKDIHRQAMIMATPDTKQHNPALIIGIILTVLLGAGVGAIVYLVFFQ